VTVRNLNHLLAPQSVALIGASTRPNSVGATVARNLLAGGLPGPVWLVNPKHPEIAGVRCYPSIAALPEAPDLAVICTPPTTVVGLLEELGQRGTHAAVVITAGPRELDDAIFAAAQRYDMRLLGPNCLGVIVPGAGLDASFAHTSALKGDLALVSQSGAIVTAVLDWAKARGIGFSHLVSLGNMIDVDVDDLLDHLATDAKVRAILLYLEGIRDARSFMSAARAAARVKPVIILKAGRHPEGARAAASHTGAMAGSDAVYDEAFERAGVVRVADLGDLFEAAGVLSRIGRISGERLAILTNGGGAGVLAVDRVRDLGGVLADVSPATVASLDRVLPAGWSKANPLDIMGDAGPERYSAAYRALLADRSVDAILALNCPTAVASSTDAAMAIATAYREAKVRGLAKPTVSAWLGAAAAAPGRRVLEEAGVPSFETPAAAVDAFMHLVAYQRSQVALLRMPSDAPAGQPSDRATAARVIAGALADGRALLSEAESKAVLAAYGIPVAATRIAKSPQGVANRAAEVIAEGGAGTRVVVKIWSRDIAHKSDVGGVRLGLLDPEEARAAAEAMLRNVASVKPEAHIEGFMVQQMISRPRAHELIVGLAGDATFGPIVLFGAGGTGVEVINDKALALPPLDRPLALALMRRTRINRLLAGYRARPPADVNAVADVLVRIGDLAADFPEVGELDINPLLADENGVIALDARILVRAAPANRHRLAIRPYPASLTSSVTLTSGLNVLMRPVRPEDERLALEFYAKLDPEDIRMRMLTPMKEPSHAFIARLTQIDYAREMAFVALDDAKALLGVSRLNGNADGDRAEFAVMVRSDLKGHGLGWQLMQKLLAYARSEGMKVVEGHVLAENTTMLKMCRELGFEVTLHPADRSLRLVQLRLA
jgi:acetyltransferase